MTKKTPPQANFDDEINQIARDFRQIVGEMTDLSSLREFPDIFRQVHALLMDSHTKNQKLSQNVQLLNSQIVSNATKVASLLKMSEEDHKAIDQYKEEFDRAWKLVNASQEKELAAKDMCEKLKDEVNRLASIVHDQSVNENAVDELKLDIGAFAQESKDREHEIEILVMDIEKYRSSEAENIVSRDKAVDDEVLLTEVINSETKRSESIITSKSALYAEIEELKESKKELTETTEKLSTEIRSIKSQLNETRQELLRQKGLENDYKADYEESHRKMMAKMFKKDKILSLNNSMKEKIRWTQSALERGERGISELNQKEKHLDGIIADHQQEMNEIQTYADAVKGEINAEQIRRRKLNLELIATMRRHGFSEAAIHHITRENDSKNRQLEIQAIKLNDAKTVHKQTVDFTGITRNNTQMVKGELQNLDTSASNIEHEMEGYQKKTNEIKVQLVRLADNQSIIANDMRIAQDSLSHLTKSSHDHDSIIRDMRNERDTISNKIDGVIQSNEELTLSINAQREKLNKLKNLVHQRTQDCIEVHFQTRGVEKQIQALNEVVRLTKRLCEESTQTIIGYKAEGTKLRMIHDEAHKDIARAKAELDTIIDISRLLQRQLCQRKIDVAKAEERATNLEHDLRRRQMHFDKQTTQLETLSDELEQKIDINHRLNSRASTASYLTIESIRLDNRLRREQEIRNRFENEFSRPLNVHRWTLMQWMAPDTYKKIQMITYLKTKLEEVSHEKRKLNEVKKIVEKQIKKENSHIQNCHINDGSYAITVYKESLAKKDQCLEEMQTEIDQKRALIEEVAGAIQDLKARLKQSHAVTTSMRRQQQTQQVIPILPIQTKTLERTRLGGGFSLGPNLEIRAQTSRTAKRSGNENTDDSSSCFSARDVSAASNIRKKKDAIEIDYPFTTRTISAASWKPRKFNNVPQGQNPELAISSTRSKNRPQSEFVATTSTTPRVTKKKTKKTSARVTKNAPNRPTTARSDTQSSFSISSSQSEPQSARRVKPASRTVGPYFGPF